jgi:hypothetical protein
MAQPAKNEKLEAFREQMIEKHEVTLRASMDLVKISNGSLYEPFATPIHKVMRPIARVVVNSNGAVLTVATAGYGNDAAKIVRSHAGMPCVSRAERTRPSVHVLPRPVRSPSRLSVTATYSSEQVVGGGGMPDARQIVSQTYEHRSVGNRDGRKGPIERLELLGQDSCLLERTVPARLEFGGDESVLRIDRFIPAGGEPRVVACLFHLQGQGLPLLVSLASEVVCGFQGRLDGIATDRVQRPHVSRPL